MEAIEAIFGEVEAMEDIFVEFFENRVFPNCREAQQKTDLTAHSQNANLFILFGN